MVPEEDPQKGLEALGPHEERLLYMTWSSLSSLRSIPLSTYDPEHSLSDPGASRLPRSRPI